jgi:hypothetical protein
VAASAATDQPARGVPLRLNQRHIVDFRVPMLGRPPAERAAQARVLLAQMLERAGPGAVAVWLQDGHAGLQVDGRIVFYLLPEDLALDLPGEPLPAAAEVVRGRLQAAIAEVREARDLRRIAEGLGWALGATLPAWGVLRLVWRLPQRLRARAATRLAAWEQASVNRGLARTTAHHAMSAAQGGLNLLAWLLVLLVVDLWVTFVLGQFAYTRPWAERSTQWLLSLVLQFALAVAGAVPGLLSAALIFFIARQLAQAVAGVGIFATRLHTGMGEEVSLPNAWVFAQPVRNFSRLVSDGQFMLHTAVTIGYATPWRQVHAMLLEAAARTPGVATDPAPYVVQTALSDFYVDYRLCAQTTHSAPQRRADAISRLHGNVQDVFNENGVQIMSPHYMADPAEPQVVKPEGWEVELVRRAGEEQGRGQ